VQLPPTYGGLRVLTPDVIKAAHKQNIRVEAWTVNDVVTMRALIDLGIDGIITDYPDILSLLDAD
jgi:glycerophosphoryl diester phosphodiesterase